MQLALFPEKIDRKVAPTNLRSNRHPIHRWANFIAGYSPEFVSECARDAGLNRGDVVLDPFAGLGTTLTQALLDGFSAVGYEANPFFHELATAKIHAATGRISPGDVFAVLESTSEYGGNLSDIFSEDALKFLKKMFANDDFRMLAGARRAENLVSEADRPLFRLVVSRIMEAVCLSQTDGVYKAPTTRKAGKPFKVALVELRRDVLTDCQDILPKPDLTAELVLGPASQLGKGRPSTASLCITSPPYLNNFDYAEMTRMELYFWGYARSWSEITERVRSQMIVNTTTAPSDLKRQHLKFATKLPEGEREFLAPIVAQLRERRDQKAGKKDYFALVYPYFAQLLEVLQGCHRVLKSESPIHVIIGDSYLYGIHIPAGDICRRLLEVAGFDSLQQVLLRTRGERWILAKREGAGTPIGEYHIYGRRN
ncbi:MAG: DNA methylase [Verrucomicrobia bacterium]|nr:DNA methylase [Verrucomicrobiota bacterium]